MAFGRWKPHQGNHGNVDYVDDVDNDNDAKWLHPTACGIEFIETTELKWNPNRPLAAPQYLFVLENSQLICAKHFIHTFFFSFIYLNHCSCTHWTLNIKRRNTFRCFLFNSDKSQSLLNVKCSICTQQLPTLNRYIVIYPFCVRAHSFFFPLLSHQFNHNKNENQIMPFIKWKCTST